jgi:predicted kinase
MKPSSQSKPHLIITVGIPGSGKSFFAEHFADTFKAPIVSYERFLQSGYSLKEDSLISLMSYILGEILKTGQTAVYDGPSDSRSERIELAKSARLAGYEPLLVWVQTDEETAKKRATKTDDKHKIAISNEEFEKIAKKFSPPHKIEHAVVISGKHNYASQLKIVLRNLASVPTLEDNSVNRISTVRRNIVLR